jgi:hypothetical protein
MSDDVAMAAPEAAAVVQKVGGRPRIFPEGAPLMQINVKITQANFETLRLGFGVPSSAPNTTVLHKMIRHGVEMFNGGATLGDELATLRSTITTQRNDTAILASRVQDLSDSIESQRDQLDAQAATILQSQRRLDEQVNALSEIVVHFSTLLQDTLAER